MSGEIVIPDIGFVSEGGSFYSSADAVRQRTGVKARDLGMETEEDVTAFLESLLLEITDLMDRKMRKSYLTDDPIPPGVNGIAADVAGDSIREMVATRQTPIVRIDDFAVRIITTHMFSEDAQDRLSLFAEGSGVHSVEMTQDTVTTGEDVIVWE